MLPRLSPGPTTCTTEGPALTLGCGPGVSRAGRGIVGRALVVGSAVGVGGAATRPVQAQSRTARLIAAAAPQLRLARGLTPFNSLIRGKPGLVLSPGRHTAS